MEKHTLSLDDRKKLTVTGVTGVDGMDGKEVEISLESGKLVVRGEGLTVSKLDTDTGNLTVTAQNISSLVYGDKNKADVDKYGRQAMEKSIVDAISVTDVGPKATKAQP